MNTDTDVAIVGMACRVPGADGPAEFWDLLVHGRVGLSRSDASGGPNFVPVHGSLADAELFDAEFFGMTPAEAAVTDPQQRLFLQACHAALEDGGYDPSRYPGLISVYGGAALNTHLQRHVLPVVDQGTTSRQFQVMIGNDKDFLATRVAYKLDLRGPAYTVQTACSTSLVAVHLACQGLIAGECDMALAGGVTVKFPQAAGYTYEEGAVLSADGAVRAFDAGASGTVAGDGVGVVVLKLLSQALADGDTVHAVIKGTATNNDGSGKVSYAAPSRDGQAAVVAEAHAVSRVEPDTITYVEAHGTGTPLGDPVEVSALTEAFRRGTDRTGFCALGTVKPNTGHLDAAAGVVSLLKATLMLRHRALVPTPNFTHPNPAIDFPATPFSVSTDFREWTAEGPLRAGVSSFGIGGTNAHAVLEEAPPATPTSVPRPQQVIVLSARTPAALDRVRADLADHLRAHLDLDLADIAHTLAVGRRPHPCRWAAVVAHREELLALLDGGGWTEPPAGEPADVLHAWLAGDPVDWAGYYADERRRRVPLPTYPFEGVLHRLPAAPGSGLHPLVGANVSTLREHRYRKAFTGAEPILSDHRVGGEPVLPATAYLEMARAAGALAGEGEVVALRDVVFERLLRAPAQVHIGLDADLGFEVTSAEGAHCRGQLVLGDRPARRVLDLVAVEARCGEDVDGVYDVLASRGLDYGPSYRVVTSVRCGDREALADLELAEHPDGCLLPPALLDGAMQTAVVLLARTGLARHLPLGVDEVRVAGPLPARCRAHVVLRAAGDHAATVDITVCDVAGEVAVELRGVSVRSLADVPRLLRPEWVDAPLEPAARDTSGRDPSGVVLFDCADRDDAVRDLLHVTRDLLERGLDGPTHVVVTHALDGGRARPEHEALGAFARSARLEHPHLLLQVVGVEATDDPLPHVLADDAEVELRVVGGRRLVKRHRPVEVEPTARFADGGVYLVTGGAGGLGLLVAEHIASSVRAHVVLAGRSERPARDLAALRARCASLTYRPVDVARADEVRRLVAELRDRHGRIDGVVHAAGVLRDSFLLRKTGDDLDAVRSGKVDGARHLLDATAADDLDFFVAFSSIAAAVGGVGQADYAWANAVLDGLGATSVAWPAWRDGGMAQDPAAAAALRARTGFTPLATAEAMAVLDRVLGVPGPLLVAAGDTDRIVAATGRAGSPAHPPVRPRHDTDVVRLVRDLVAEVTGNADVDPDVPFEHYGIDSLVITGLNAALERRFGAVPKTLFYEHATVRELADHLAGAGARAARIEVREPEDDAIAVIGISARLPMARDLDEFWTNLVAGRDCVTTVPTGRWDHDRYFDPDPARAGRTYSKWGGFLDGIDEFDPLFFGISPREAALLDPQERLFLQAAWHAVEDAGLRRSDLAPLEVGVYVGAMYDHYQLHGAADAERGDGPVAGSSRASIANRVSYALNLRGPSLGLDTMCSSSLTAIHLACASLRAGETDLAIAGGVNITSHPYKYVYLSQGRFLSDDGRCRSFGEGGTGYVPGEGVGAVLLKPRARALADGDHVHGVILGSAVNHGGHTHAYTVPNPAAQQRVVTTALRRAGVRASRVGYVEAHGTGTALGDPIEIAGLRGAFDAAGAACAIGSVKSNIGHLESAAGMAALAKVLLQLRHRTLVPSLHADPPNPDIDFAGSPFTVQREVADWAEPADGGPRVAGISSFGAGGSNAHLVVQEHPRPRADRPAAEQRLDRPAVLVLSARDEDRLREYAADLSRYLRREHVPLADVVHTLAAGREEMDHRLALVFDDGATAAAELAAFADGRPGAVLLGRARRGAGVATGDPADLARRWVEGAEARWPDLPGRRIPAPVYPFARERHWVADRRPVEPRPRWELDAEDPSLRDHSIGGTRLLAGGASLQLVLASTGRPHVVRDLTWVRPITSGTAVVAVREDRFTVVDEAGAVLVTGAVEPGPGTPVPRVDLAQLRDRCATRHADADVRRRYRAGGFHYGRSYDVLAEVRGGHDEALVRVCAPDGAEPGWARDGALLDGALRACHWVRPDDPMHIPFSLTRLEVFAPLPAAFHAHARLIGDGAVRRFDVTLIAEDGVVLARAHDLAGRPPHPAGELYRPEWVAEEVRAAGGRAATLVVLGGSPELRRALDATGAWARVEPGDPEGLAEVLAGQDGGVDVVDLLGGGALSALRLLHTVADLPGDGRVRCAYVHGGGPEHEAVVGFARSVPAVLPRLELCAVEAAEDVDLAAALAAEFTAGSGFAGADLRWRAGRRWVRRAGPVPDVPDAPVPLVEGGTYLLTGATGAVGRVLGDYLADRWRARMVLLCRSEPDERVRRWEDAGARVLVVRGDVADRADVDRAVAAARSAFGRISGVFHLAGEVDTTPATRLDADRFAGSTAAKATGLVHLDRATADEPPDLFVVFGSISSVLGDFGTCGYAAANRFADAYAEQRAGRTVSLAWPLWDCGGVDALVDDRQRTRYTEATGLEPIDAPTAIRLLERALAVGETRLIPVVGDPARIEAVLAGPRPVGAAEVPALRDDLVQHLRDRVAGVLGASAAVLDVDTPLIEYGLDSVLVVEAAAGLTRVFPGLRATVFFEHPTLRGLAEHLLRERRPDVDRLLGGSTTRPAPASPVAAPAVPARVDPARRAPRSEPSSDEDIAIIGISGRYPHAKDLDGFWEVLRRGEDCVDEVPVDRWDAEALFGPAPSPLGRSYSRWGGFLSDVDAFDPMFFGIPPKHARSMDPQERLFLQTAWDALEDAGYPPSALPRPKFSEDGHDVGVFVGVMWDDYAVLGAELSFAGQHNLAMTNRSSIANRLSHFADFRGPSLVVDTACSSSLVALHLACESIRRGECSHAVVGGVNVAAHPLRYTHLSRRRMLSRDGRCRSFGAGATGYVPGEGVGAVLLKRLSAAEADGDRVHAVIKATAINHGGRTSGFTVPNPHAQRALVAEALHRAGIDAATIGYVEAHGTGTALGDPIEHAALARAYRDHTDRRGFCALGSVKSNIGHSEGAAGIAGLTKVVLQLRHRQLVPSLHAGDPNPDIDFTDSPFVLQRELADWPAPPGGGPRRAAISSFGAGGANAHVIVEEHVPVTWPRPAPAPELVVLSARTEERLRARAGVLADFLREPDHPALPDLAHTLRTGREAMSHRLAFVARRVEDAVAKLAEFAAGEQPEGVVHGDARGTSALTDLFDVDGGRDFLRRVALAGHDAKLARLWVDGLAVDWTVLTDRDPGHRSTVSLPGYPFALERHWLPAARRATAPHEAASPRPHARLLEPGDPVVRDHVVGGRSILPGAGHLDLVAAALGGGPLALEHVRWTVPLVVDADPVEVAVAVDEDRVEVRVGATSHFTARTTALGAEPPAVAVAEVAARCGRRMTGAQTYHALADRGLAYGPFFRAVHELRVGDGEALGVLRAPAGGEGHALHPGLLDAALHTAVGLVLDTGSPLLPAAARRVEVHRALPVRGHSHVRALGGNRFDVVLTDEDGRVCVRVTDLTCLAARPARGSTYRPRWVEEPVEPVAPPEGPVLVVGARRAEVAAALPGVDVLERVEDLTGPPECAYFAGGDVVELFSLVTALDRRGFLAAGRLRVITTGAFPRDGEGGPDPDAAALSGFCASLAKEFPGLRVSCVDLGPDGSPGDAVREPFPPKPVPVSVRDGVRRVRRLEPVRLDPPRRSAFREGGVYLIVGGQGVVGADTAVHLASRYRAKLVLLGRSGPDPRVLERVERAGGEVLHLSCDATDPEALRAAVARVKDRFGALHGVVNSAMVLITTPLRRLDESGLRAAFDAKARTTGALHEALRDEELDFLLHYSSGVAFEGNAGHTGYAAGCCYQDACAARPAPFPVKVVNWGFWHAGGDPERERVLARLAAAGVEPITADEGMRVVEGLLAGPLTQVLATKVDQRTLEGMGVDPDAAPTAPPVPPSVPLAPSASTALSALTAPPVSSVTASPATGVEHRVRSVFARVLGAPGEELDPRVPFDRYGVDSLVAVELVDELEREFGRLPASVLHDHGTIAALTDHLGRNPDPAPAEPVPAMPGDGLVAAVADLTDQQVHDLLGALTPPAGERP
ncbi:SDR family NAD(P)-dependent oxidoreductase [Actinosynnema sp. CA-299493]